MDGKILRTPNVRNRPSASPDPKPSKLEYAKRYFKEVLRDSEGKGTEREKEKGVEREGGSASEEVRVVRGGHREEEGVRPSQGTVEADHLLRSGVPPTTETSPLQSSTKAPGRPPWAHASANFSVNISNTCGAPVASTPRVPLATDAGECVERAHQRLKAELLRCRLAKGATGVPAHGPKTDEANNVMEMLQEVESHLWPIIRDFAEIGKKSPPTLLAAKRVLQDLERDEAEIVSLTKGKLLSGGPTSKTLPWRSRGAPQEAVKPESRFLRRWYHEISVGVDGSFRDLLDRMVKSANIDDVLVEADRVASGLDVVQSLKAYFPAHYEFPAYVRQLYISKFVEAGQRMSADASNMDMGTIRKVLAWAANLKRQVVKLGIEESLASVPLEYGALNPLIEEYETKMSTFVAGYFSNLLAIAGREVVEKEREKLHTNVPVEMFRMLYQQVEVARDTGNSLLLSRVAAELSSQVVQALHRQLEGLRQAQQEAPAPDQVKLFFAVMNDAFRGREHMDQLIKDIMSSLDKRHQDDLDLEAIKGAFVDLARRVARLGMAQVFRQEAGLSLREGITDKFQRNFELLTEVLKSWLRPDAYNLSLQVLFEHLVVACVEELVHQKRQLDVDRMQELERDTETIEGMFVQHLDTEILQDRLELLVQVREIAFADSMESAVMGYRALLGTSWPECSPVLIEKLMAHRSGFEASEIKAAVKECRAAWEEQALSRENSRNPSFLKAGVEIERCLTTNKSGI